MLIEILYAADGDDNFGSLMCLTAISAFGVARGRLDLFLWGNDRPYLKPRVDHPHPRLSCRPYTLVLRDEYRIFGTSFRIPYQSLWSQPLQEYRPLAFLK